MATLKAIDTGKSNRFTKVTVFIASLPAMGRQSSQKNCRCLNLFQAPNIALNQKFVNIPRTDIYVNQSQAGFNRQHHVPESGGEHGL